MRGISPIVAVVLLIAISVTAAVGLYLWMGTMTGKQAVPNTPTVITASVDGTTSITMTNPPSETKAVLVQNLGQSDITLPMAKVSKIGITTTNLYFTYMPTSDTTYDSNNNPLGIVCLFSFAINAFPSVYKIPAGKQEMCQLMNITGYHTTASSLVGNITINAPLAIYLNESTSAILPKGETIADILI